MDMVKTISLGSAVHPAVLGQRIGGCGNRPAVGQPSARHRWRRLTWRMDSRSGDATDSRGIENNERWFIPVYLARRGR